ncbi:hypothetical protein BGZ67_010637 [Mortierella alpina]|nr:hypothetical protein BGZ67_010637 [Mortierella alpina]
MKSLIKHLKPALMSRPNFQPKDALILATVTLLFIYFGVILKTNYEIILPFRTPLFWAAALSVPLHALKSALLPVLHEALENDILDILASTIGAIVTFIIRFFLGRYITYAIKTLFLGYCHVMHVLCDGRSTSGTKDEASQKGAPEDGVDRRELDTMDEDNYELHPNYQTLVDQEPDDYARAPNSPSYLNLLRLALVYGLLQLATPEELWTFVKTAWSETPIGTAKQLSQLMFILTLHIAYSCFWSFVSFMEALLYRNLTEKQLKEQSVLHTVPRFIRKAMQQSLNSTLTTVIVLSTIAVLGALSAILSVGVVHDVHGLIAQTHHRVMFFRQEQSRPALGDTEDLVDPKQSLVKQMDTVLSQAYDAGLELFNPILKDAFPDLAWGATEWAAQVANVVVDSDYKPATTSYQATKTTTCRAPPKTEPDPVDLFQPYKTVFADDPESLDDSEDLADEPTVQEDTVQQPEMWTIPTLKFMRLSGSRFQSAQEFVAQKLPQQQPSKAINVSHAKHLLNVLLDYKGLDTPNILYGFNAFNDLLFRWILFVLGLITFTGLRVSPLQRIGWLIDQALASSPSFGSFRLSTSPSPGRILAKSLEFSISGTFISMFKLSIYHTLFTLTLTHYLGDRVMGLAAVGAASSNFVAIKYAWLTSLFGIVLTVFPIAPNWLVAIPGALIHFYVYGERPVEALAMVAAHMVFTMFVDGTVWDSHVVRTARPSVSSAFWLGLWIFLGGMKWGTKGLLLGPVLYAAVPAIWAAVLELRGVPSKQKAPRRSASTETGRPFHEHLEKDVQDKFYSRPRGSRVCA